MIQRMFVTIDTRKTNYKNVGKINHGDDLILELTVLSDGYMISFNDPMVDLLVKKSDGKMIRQNYGIEYIGPNKFIIEVSKDCLTSPGLVTNQLIINDNGRISTCMFYYTILKSLEEDIIESISNVEVLEQLDEFTIQIKDKMENFDEELRNRMSELEDDIINNENSRISNETERQKTLKEMKNLIYNVNSFDERIGVIDDEIEEINSSLDTKANKNELMSLDNSKMDKDTTNISITQINKNLGKIDQTFLTDELINQISGSTPINATISPRSVTTDKLAYKSVTPCETSFFEDIINIFNYKTATDGYYVDKNNGNLVAEANNFVSDFILIENNTQYKSKHWGTIASYDASKKFISGADINPSNPYTTPSSSCYIRYSVTGIHNKTVAMLCKSIYDNSKFIPFGKTNIKNEYIDIDYIKNQLMISDNIPLILPGNTSFFGNHLNLFDVSKATIGTAINGANGELLVGSGYENNYISDFIKINQDNVYYASQYSIFHFYDKNKKWIGKGNNDGNGKPNKPLDNSVYMRINGVNKENINSNYVCENEYTNYSHPYDTIFLKDEHIDKASLSGWKGKKWCSFGHSIVQQEKWQNKVSKYFDFKHINCGIGGSTVCGTDGSTGSNPMWTDERINAIPTDCDLITILAGVNDQRDTDNMGAWGSKDTETFYGAYTVMLEKIYKRCPNAKIILMRDTRRKKENWGIWKADDYREAVSKIGKEFGYPVIDMDKLCGINYLNWDTYLMDDTHPNDLGGMKMSEVVIGFLKSIYPLQ